MDSDINISESDMVRIVYIATFVDYKGVLKTDKGSYITKSTMFDLLKVNRNTFNKFYNSMIEHLVFTECDGKIILNDNYYIKGSLSVKNNNHIRVFINAMRNLYQSNRGKNMITIGHVFKLLPYVTYRKNKLCWNPHDNEAGFLSAKEMIKILGLNPSNVLRELRKLAKLEINGLSLFKFITNHIDYTEDLILINPILFYKGNIKDYEEDLKYYLDIDKNN